MQIEQIGPFLEYLKKVRQRTMRVLRCVPADKLEWTFRPGKFTIGDLARHVATIERYMFVETVIGSRSAYSGCGRDLADGYDQVMQFLETLHAESVSILSTLSDSDLGRKCITPEGSPITAWKWLRAMVEHEIHHRGQIYLYMAMLEVATPPLYGLTSEQVLERSVKP
jgi:uncharacterized damage-inducible protein DinB